MPVGLNKARGEASASRVHGSWVFYPIYLFPPGAQAPGLGHVQNSPAVGELTLPRHCFFGSYEEMVQPKALKGPARRDILRLTPSLLHCDGKSKELSNNLSDSKESSQLPS